MTIRIFISAFLFLLFSCQSEEKTLIPKDKFTALHGEILTIESYYRLNYGSPGVYKDSLKSSVDEVLKKYGVTFKEYENTYNYYAVRQEEFQQINKDLIRLYNKKKL